MKGPVFHLCVNEGFTSIQASGVTVTDDVIAVFNDMKVRKAQANEEDKKKRKKAVLFCISPDKQNIILEEGKAQSVLAHSAMASDIIDIYLHENLYKQPIFCRPSICFPPTVDFVYPRLSIIQSTDHR